MRERGQRVMAFRTIDRAWRGEVRLAVETAPWGPAGHETRLRGLGHGRPPNHGSQCWDNWRRTITWGLEGLLRERVHSLAPDP